MAVYTKEFYVSPWSPPVDSVEQGILPFTKIGPTMNISIPHNLGEAEATNRIKKLITETRPSWQNMVSNVDESWVGNKGDFSFKAMGQNVSGNILVQPNTVDVSVKLPLTLLPFRPKIEQELTNRARQLLS